MRVVEHAPRGPHQFLERIHGLAEIVKRGLVVVVELSPAPRRRFETTRPSSRRLRALRRRPRHGPHHHRVLVPACRPRLHTLAPRPRVRCSIVSFARRRGCNPQNPTAVLPCFGQRDRPLPPRARQRFADGCCARVLVVSDSRQHMKLVELAFCCDRVCSVMEPI